MKRSEQGKFLHKLDEAKKLYSFRLTQYAIAYIEMVARNYGTTRTDVIEAWTRGEYDKAIILTAIDQYINSQLTQSGGNQHRKKGEVANIENSRDWKRLRQFKEWIERNN